MRILPVLDLKAGQVVRGIAGRREEYQPIISLITPSAEPLRVAEAFREHFGLSEIYLADLDAISGAPPSLATHALLQSSGFRLWVDAGIYEEAQALSLPEVDVIILGLETIAGPEVLAGTIAALGPGRVAFSLDLKDGQALGAATRWGTSDAWSIACQAVERGVRRIVVLDLARVGMASGTGTEDLCQRLVRAFPEMEVVAGGGVRGPEDLRRLRDVGVHAVLVASALHDGRLTREEALAFGSPLNG